MNVELFFVRDVNEQFDVSMHAIHCNALMESGNCHIYLNFKFAFEFYYRYLIEYRKMFATTSNACEYFGMTTKDPLAKLVLQMVKDQPVWKATHPCPFKNVSD